MTYNELKAAVAAIKPARSSHLNRERLINKGLGPGVWDIKGNNGKHYTVTVNCRRCQIDIFSKHRQGTLDKHCHNAICHLVEVF